MGCSSVPLGPPSPQIFQDGLFAPGQEPIDAKAVFAISPAMQAFLTRDFPAHGYRKDPREALVQALNSKAQLRLEYDSARTRTASEAFDARSGNCLSLVLMTAAFAKELGLPVRYRSVFVDPAWSRSKGPLLPVRPCEPDPG